METIRRESGERSSRGTLKDRARERLIGNVGKLGSKKGVAATVEVLRAVVNITPGTMAYSKDLGVGVHNAFLMGNAVMIGNLNPGALKVAGATALYSVAYAGVVKFGNMLSLKQRAAMRMGAAGPNKMTVYTVEALKAGMNLAPGIWEYAKVFGIDAHNLFALANPGALKFAAASALSCAIYAGVAGMSLYLSRKAKTH